MNGWWWAFVVLLGWIAVGLLIALGLTAAARHLKAAWRTWPDWKTVGQDESRLDGPCLRRGPFAAVGHNGVGRAR
ncbi:hypothetical protein WEH80_01425 [Actinomycetes bacterium KLBMP 9759]